MRVFQLQKQVYQAARLANKVTELSKVAQERLAKLNTITALRKKGLGVREAVQAVGISKATYYRWRKLAEKGPQHLHPRSSRPHFPPPRKSRTPALKAAVLKVRAQFPVWGKQKIKRILQRNGVTISASSIGRILAEEFKARRLPTAYQLRNGQKVKRSVRRRPHAVRMKSKPTLTQPGQLVQIDSMTVTLAPGVVVKQFNASCPVSRWSVGEVFSAATATCGAKFLSLLLERFPFPIAQIQVDGGSEFMVEFEEGCRTRALPLFVLPPRSPKLNGSVERCNGTWRYEFWQNETLPLTVRELRAEVHRFEKHFNTVRPHQALDYRTPEEYRTEWVKASTQNVS